MRAGSLRHRVTLRQHTEVRSPRGGWTDTPVVIADRISAFVEPITATSPYRAAEIDPRATHQMLLRYREDITAGLEAIYHDRRGDRVFEIVGPPIDTGERHRELLVHCMEASGLA